MANPMENEHLEITASFDEGSERSAEAIARRAKEYVIGQDGFVDSFSRSLCLALACAQMRVAGTAQDDLPKASAMLVYGPTASGKTFAVKRVAAAAGIQLFLIDTSSLTGEGWRGNSVSDELARVAVWQEEHPGEPCLLIWDEADKMCLKGRREDASFSPQANLLKLLDEEDSCRFRREDAPGQAYVEIDARPLVHVFLGAFEGAEEIARRASRSFGFLPGQDAAGSSLGIGHLVEYGMLAELAGRIGATFSLPALREDSLKAIVKGSGHSLERRYANVMPPGCGFEVDDVARDLLVEQALATPFGVRALGQAVCRAGAEALSVAQADETVTLVTLKVDSGAIAVEATRDDGGARRAALERAERAGAAGALPEAGGKPASPSRMARTIDGSLRHGAAFRLGESLEGCSRREAAEELVGILMGREREQKVMRGLATQLLELLFRYMAERFAGYPFSLGEAYAYCDAEAGHWDWRSITPVEFALESASAAGGGKDLLTEGTRELGRKYCETPVKHRAAAAEMLRDSLNRMVDDEALCSRVAAAIERRLDDRQAYWERLNDQLDSGFGLGDDGMEGLGC